MLDKKIKQTGVIMPTSELVRNTIIEEVKDL